MLNSFQIDEQRGVLFGACLEAYLLEEVLKVKPSSPGNPEINTRRNREEIVAAVRARVKERTLERVIRDTRHLTTEDVLIPFEMA